MINATGADTGSRSEARKSLKDQNRWQLWIIVAANTLFLYGVVQANAIKFNGLQQIGASLLSTFAVPVEAQHPPVQQ